MALLTGEVEETTKTTTTTTKKKKIIKMETCMKFEITFYLIGVRVRE